MLSRNITTCTRNPASASSAPEHSPAAPGIRIPSSSARYPPQSTTTVSGRTTSVMIGVRSPSWPVWQAMMGSETAQARIPALICACIARPSQLARAGIHRHHQPSQASRPWAFHSGVRPQGHAPEPLVHGVSEQHERGDDAEAELEAERPGVERACDDEGAGDPPEERGAVVAPARGVGDEQGEHEHAGADDRGLGRQDEHVERDEQGHDCRLQPAAITGETEQEHRERGHEREVEAGDGDEMDESEPGERGVHGREGIVALAQEQGPEEGARLGLLLVGRMGGARPWECRGRRSPRGNGRASRRSSRTSASAAVRRAHRGDGTRWLRGRALPARRRGPLARPGRTSPARRDCSRGARGGAGRRCGSARRA